MQDCGGSLSAPQGEICAFTLQCTAASNVSQTKYDAGEATSCRKKLFYQINVVFTEEGTFCGMLWHKRRQAAVPCL